MKRNNRAVILFLVLVPFTGVSATNYPPWWLTRNVIGTNATANDYAPVMAGQLKWMAAKAYEELQTNLPGGAGTGVAALVSSFTTSNNYVPINLGQLKYVAEPFYVRLIAEDFAGACPWTAATTDDADFAMANLGQLKTAFNFDIAYDSDNDSIPDWWEKRYGLNPTSPVPGTGEGWWKFDEGAGTSAFNSAGADYDGQLMNMTTAWEDGKLGSALAFDGTDDYVRIPQNPALVTGSQFAISAWAWYDGSAADKYPSVMADMTNCGGDSYSSFWMGYDQDYAGIEGAFGACSYNNALAPMTITGRWVHLVLSYDGTNGSLYADGVRKAVTSGAFGSAKMSEIRIGWADDPSYTYHWKGKLDDVRLYKTALSSNEIATMYEEFLDPDGDGYSNLEEFRNGTDPTNWSIPPPLFLHQDGRYIKDESNNVVTLKAVNIGGWLAFEQWMVGFEPKNFTNAVGKSTATNHMDETTLRDFLVNNVDYATNLLAAQNSGASGINTQSWDGKLVIGGFNNGSWIRFANVNFGTGVSNLSVIVTLGDATQRYFEIHTDSLTGTMVGTMRVLDTGSGWGTYTEQRLSGISVSGTHDVYFKGLNDGVGNIYRFRFYRDANTQPLLDTFRNSYFTTNDLDHLKSLGYNCIRLPFLYNLLQDETGTNYLSNGWARLDWVLSECQKRRMWCILDLHGTPGGQNYSDHSGQPEGLRNAVWTSQIYKERTSNLWAKIAERYSTNRAVAGYDLFNEPDPYRSNNTVAVYQQVYSNSILLLASTLYSAIRAKDTNHLIIIESNFMYTNMWNDIWTCPAPASRGWTNVVYEFHHYDHSGPWCPNDTYDVSFATQKEIADRIVRTYTRFMAERQVPVFIGEFGSITVQNIDYFVRQFHASGIHWGQWNFRHFGYDDTRWPWSGWGLDYRIGGSSSSVNTNIQPNVKTDSFTVLSNKLAQYTRANYAAHPYMPDVIENTAGETNTANERTEFYLNTFDGPTRYNFNDANAWPWRKTVAVYGATNKFWILNNRGRLRLATGPVAFRLASRTEADARFETLDSTGCWFSVDIGDIYNTNPVTGPETEIRLVVSRDAVTNLIYSEPAPAVVARLSFDQGVGISNVNICLYSRIGSVSGTYGNLLCSNTITFVTGMPLRIYMDGTTALIAYNGVTNSGLHGQTNWTGGAVCLLEAEDKTTGGTVFAEVDNLKVWRPNVGYSSGYTNGMTEYPSGIYALAEPERLAIRRWNPSDDWVNSYMTNGTLRCIPERMNNGWQCVNPRRDYQNDVRLNLTASNVVEIRAAYTNFTQGIAKICALPEYFPGETFNEYQGSAVYVEMSRNGTNLQMAALRQFSAGLGGRVTIGSNSLAYVEGQAVSLQVSAETLKVYYGTDCPINVSHGLTNAVDAYSYGVHPHYEFLNSSNTTTATVQMKALKCRGRTDFGMTE